MRLAEEVARRRKEANRRHVTRPCCIEDDVDILIASLTRRQARLQKSNIQREKRSVREESQKKELVRELALTSRTQKSKARPVT